MMSVFRGGDEMTPKNWILEGKNRTLRGDGGSKIVKNRRTSFMNDPLKQPLNLDLDFKLYFWKIINFKFSVFKGRANKKLWVNNVRLLGKRRAT